MRAGVESPLRGQVLRYAINGLVATAVHYAILRFNMEVIQMQSAGFANGIAAIFGIGVSFLGSRYFVFRATAAPVVRQGVLFLIAYGAIAVAHGLVLYLWSDVYALGYTSGFLLATVLQVCCSFLVNKFMVFR